MFLAGVSLAVAAIPEGLPAIVTVALSLGVQRMIRQKSIVRKLPAVETLGCASIICSDKTGTMTQNKMTVTHVWSGGKIWNVSGIGYEPEGSFSMNGRDVQAKHHKPLQQVLLFGALCNSSSIIEKDGEFRLDGDPTEGALLTAARKAGFTDKYVDEHFKIIEEFPFDSDAENDVCHCGRQERQALCHYKGRAGCIDEAFVAYADRRKARNLHKGKAR